MNEHILTGLPEPGAARMLVIGDLILDEYWRGSVARISPEAPVPILESTAFEQTLGGAGNVARNLADLGCAIHLCGVIGDDSAGACLMRLIAKHNFDTAGIFTLTDRPTTHKLRVVAQVQHLLRIDREVKLALQDDVGKDVVNFVQRHLNRVQGIICSDYKKGVLTATVLQQVIALARGANIPVFVDPKGDDYAAYRGATLLTPNLREVQQASGITIDGPRDLDCAAHKLLGITAARGLLVTCGKDGMVLYQPGRDKIQIAAAAREVFDVTGAGDTVIAAMAYACLGQAPLEQAARLANVAAGLVVAKLGTASITRRELICGLDLLQGRGDAKILSLKRALEVVRQAQRQQRRVVFTNGCFDLLHAGHVQFLQAARRMGDILVLGLNTDASIRRLKGSQRPLMPEDERACLLAALTCVDHVVLFDEDTPYQLVEALRPDILVKGEDYRDREVVGRATVEAMGGRVELIELLEGRSTSNLVQTILERYR